MDSKKLKTKEIKNNMKNEKTYLIGEMAIEISQLKAEKELIRDKLYTLYDQDFITHTLKWDAMKSTISNDEFKKIVKEEKEGQ